MALISATPPEVAGCVRDFVIRVNRALLDDQPRVSRESLRESLRLVRELGESLKGRVILHDEYIRLLIAHGLLEPTTPTPIRLPIPRPTRPGPKRTD